MGISFNAASLLNGNGIDVSAIVSEIQAGQSGQLTTWKGDQTTLQTQATTIGNINNDLSSLLTSVQALSDPTGALIAGHRLGQSPNCPTGRNRARIRPPTACTGPSPRVSPINCE